MDYPSTISTKMKLEYNFQADFDAPIMPSCMYEQSQTSGLFNTTFQTTSNNKLYRFHLAKENAAFNGCRRKLEFNQNSQPSIYGLKPGQQITVARRNERERNRVKLINMTFATLRDHLPFEPETNSKNKKMSKVDTLKAAISYIKHLQELVDNHDAVSAVLSEACALDTMSFDLRSACPLESPEKSPPEASGVESETSFDGLSAGEEDLVDFANWF